MVKILLAAGLLCFVSLIAGAAALILAEFGAPVWIFILLFAWLLTVGLPTLSAVLLLARFWVGPSFPVFVVLAVLLAFVFQLAALWAVRQGIRKWLRKRAI